MTYEEGVEQVKPGEPVWVTLDHPAHVHGQVYRRTEAYLQVRVNDDEVVSIPWRQIERLGVPF